MSIPRPAGYAVPTGWLERSGGKVFSRTAHAFGCAQAAQVSQSVRDHLVCLRPPVARNDTMAPQGGPVAQKPPAVREGPR
jgi:hypothetical protein